MSIEDLALDVVRARMRHLCALFGLTAREPEAEADGFQAVLAPGDGEGELFFASAPRGADYLSLALVLVVDESFLTENVEEVLEVASGYEVSAQIKRDESLGAGEVYLSLSIRIFRPGLNDRVFELALENLRAAGEALADHFS